MDDREILVDFFSGGHRTYAPLISLLLHELLKGTVEAANEALY
jgi:hypothetical protein